VPFLAKIFVTRGRGDGVFHLSAFGLMTSIGRDGLRGAIFTDVLAIVAYAFGESAE
jgi:hypothetical protein